jgi:NAD(P)-dependent dehydrogenase (short-subunit alcohol dehydrogenase family)
VLDTREDVIGGSDAGDRLAGAVALVTGGGRGLGRLIARSLAWEGARVAVAARTSDELDDTVERIRLAHGQALAVPFDLLATDDGPRLVGEVEQTLGPITLLINNAGVMAPIGLDWEIDPAAWWRTMEVNVHGTFMCTRAVLPGMIARRRGRIINVSSSAVFKAHPYYSAYGASKAAITHMTGSLAAAIRRHGLSVFAFGPGFIHTRMTEELADYADVYPCLEKYRIALAENRVTDPERVVAAIRLLASGAADALSGRHLDVADDLPALIRQAERIALDDLYTIKRRV